MERQSLIQDKTRGNTSLLISGVTPREETQGEKFLNLASSAGLPAAFPPDAADFANYPGTAGLCTQNVQQNLQCGSSALENPPGDLSKLQIFYGMSWEMLW